MNHHLSIKGVARRYLNLNGIISIRNDIMPKFYFGSVRNWLEIMATEEIAFKKIVENCTPKTAIIEAYQQVWTHITVRVMFLRGSRLDSSRVKRRLAEWKKAIESSWSDQWASNHPNEISCPFTFEVQWVNNRPHHFVILSTGRRGIDRTFQDMWYVNNTTGDIAAHEFGHMLGHPDEYPESICPDRSPVNTGTIMDSNAPIIPNRLIKPFADRIKVNLIEI